MASLENMDGWYDEVETLLNNKTYFEAFSGMQKEDMPFSCVVEYLSLMEKDSMARDAFNAIIDRDINVVNAPGFEPDLNDIMPEEMAIAWNILNYFFLWYRYKKRRLWSSHCNVPCVYSRVVNLKKVSVTSREFRTNFFKNTVHEFGFSSDK